MTTRIRSLDSELRIRIKHGEVAWSTSQGCYHDPLDPDYFMRLCDSEQRILMRWCEEGRIRIEPNGQVRLT